jgi:tetratricopeptide (TPR) repeat protein
LKQRRKETASKAKSAETATAARPPLSRRRLWLFRLGALALPVVFLGAVELILRLAGAGYDPHFFTDARSADGQVFLEDNPRFSQRFFPPQLTRWPNSVRIATAKPAKVRRIFIFGESAAMGDPQPSYGPGRCMEVLLRERFPGEEFEIVNLGITAINSHVIRPIAHEVAARGQGDVWLIYMGNNEMVGPFGAITVFGSRAPPLTAVRLNLALQQTRLGQLAVQGLRQLGGKPKNTSWGGMQMFLENQIPPDDPRRATVYRNFATNLRDIVRAGLAAEARVILSTMSVNLRDCPPFASLTNTNRPTAELAAFNDALAAGRAAATNGQFAAAENAFAGAARLAPTHAETLFRWAECLAQLGQTNAAREKFQAACDSDALPFRADTQINAAIRQLAAELAGARLALCDSEAALARAGALGIPGAESFFEHVHFDLDGNYRLGRVWADAVVQALGLATNGAPAWLPQSQCEQRLGLTDWNRLFVIQAVIRRLNAPPLSSQFNNAARLAAAQATEANLKQRIAAPNAAIEAGDLMNAALHRAPNDVFLYEGAANLLEATGHADQAIASLQLGRLLGEQGRAAEGQPYLEAATRQRPSIPDAWHELGVVLEIQKKYEAALVCTARTLELRPQDPSHYYYHGRVLARLKRHAEAIQFLRRALELKSDSWETHFELAGELAWSNEISESIRHYLEAVKLNPRHPATRVNLGVVLVRQNRISEAIAQFEAALQLDPGYKEAADYLRQVRAKAPAGR